MSVRTSVFSILLLSSDSDVHAQFKEVFKDASVVAARDAAALPKDVAKRVFDAVIVESKQGSTGDANKLLPTVDPAHTLVVTGSRQALKRASKMMKGMGGEPVRNGSKDSPSLENLIEWKMEHFVKGMRNGSARNLHPILISAIERPLISLALKETRGNQIQAAELLGLNRNTLRKKIQDLRIPVKRHKAEQHQTA